jgi:sucrose-6-phosphate hydrolase SacC (GH32 family)
LSLRTTRSGIRLFAWPVREIEGLRAQGRALTSLAVEPGTNRLAAGGGAECLDLSAEFAVGTATRLGLDVRGTPVVWDAASQTLACGSEKAPLAAEEGMLRLRILVDRGSLEVFGNGGAVAVSVHALHDPANLSVATICEGGAARLSRFESFALRSVWSGF